MHIEELKANLRNIQAGHEEMLEINEALENELVDQKEVNLESQGMIQKVDIHYNPVDAAGDRDSPAE